MSLRVKKVFGKMCIFIQVRHVYDEQVVHQTSIKMHIFQKILIASLRQHSHYHFDILFLNVELLVLLILTIKQEKCEGVPNFMPTTNMLNFNSFLDQF